MAAAGLNKIDEDVLKAYAWNQRRYPNGGWELAELQSEQNLFNADRAEEKAKEEKQKKHLKLAAAESSRRFDDQLHEGLKSYNRKVNRQRSLRNNRGKIKAN